MNKNVLYIAKVVLDVLLISGTALNGTAYLEITMDNISKIAKNKNKLNGLRLPKEEHDDSYLDYVVVKA